MQKIKTNPTYAVGKGLRIIIDENIENMKKVINEIIPNSKIVLFGSRAKGYSDKKSDYDILVVSSIDLTVTQKRKLASKIRSKLASMDIDIDILVKTEQDVNYYRDKIGSIVRVALLEGINL